jgi:hypothetical protein
MTHGRRNFEVNAALQLDCSKDQLALIEPLITMMPQAHAESRLKSCLLNRCLGYAQFSAFGCSQPQPKLLEKYFQPFRNEPSQKKYTDSFTAPVSFLSKRLSCL